MYKYLFISGLLVLSVQSTGQNSKRYLIDEYTLSVNRTLIQNSNTENRSGFGFGIYHLFLRHDILNLIAGLELNQTTQVQEYISEHHFSHWTDVKYTTNCISIPYGLRLNFDRKPKIFIESGGYIDMVFDSKQEGTYHYYPPVIKREDYLRNMDLELKNTVGLYLGVGIKIPVSKYLMIIKINYKHGLNPLYADPENIYNRYLNLTVGIKLN